METCSNWRVEFSPSNFRVVWYWHQLRKTWHIIQRTTHLRKPTEKGNLFSKFQYLAIYYAWYSIIFYKDSWFDNVSNPYDFQAKGKSLRKITLALSFSNLQQLTGKLEHSSHVLFIRNTKGTFGLNTSYTWISRAGL